MTLEEERAAWEALLASAGWPLLSERAHRLYDRDVLDHLTRVVEQDKAGEALALDQIRQIMAVRKAMLTLLAWPRRRLAELEGARPSPVHSRRGAL